jgi:AcrR family transcriptional regulator
VTDRAPSGIALTWGVRPPRTRGPAASLSVEDIAGAGVRIADRNGLAAVTMEAVARSLGCTKMALYRYVHAKQDVVALMFDAAIGEPPASVTHARSWQSALRKWATALVATYRAHPWMADVPLGSAALTRNQASWLEAALTALDNVRLPVADKLDAVLLVNATVQFHAKLVRDAENPRAQPPEAAGGLVPPAVFPRVSEVLHAGLLADDDPLALFTRGLDYVLAGISARVSSP